MNCVQLIGIVVWPVDVWNDIHTGRAIGKVMLAVSSDEQPLAFVPVILNGNEALDAGKYLGEGSRVEVTGYLHSSLVTRWDANGNTRTRRLLHVIAKRVTYLKVRQPEGGERP